MGSPQTAGGSSRTLRRFTFSDVDRREFTDRAGQNLAVLKNNFLPGQAHDLMPEPRNSPRNYKGSGQKLNWDDDETPKLGNPIA